LLFVILLPKGSPDVKREKESPLFEKE